MRSFAFEDATGTSARHLNRILDRPKLPRDETLRLVRQFQETGDLRARDTIILHYQTAVMKAAREFQKKNPRVEISELLGEGNLGLIRAIAKFEEGKGYEFPNYVKLWASSFMRNHLKKMRHAAHVTTSAWRKHREMALSNTTVSIDELVRTDADSSEGDFDPLGALGIYTPPHENELPSLEKVIERFGTGLNERETEIVRMRGNDETYSSIGERFGFSLTRAEQIYKGALGKIRKNIARSGVI